MHDDPRRTDADPTTLESPPPTEEGRLARAALVALAGELGDDEVRVLVRIAERLRMGARLYGRLDLAQDARDFGGKEAREELEDFLVYLACGWLKAEGRPPRTE